MKIIFTIILFAVSTQFSAQTITSFSPTSGKAGTSVTLLGTDFSSEVNGNSVFISRTMATIVSSTITSITFTIPEGVTSGPIQVTTNNTTTISSSIFTIDSNNHCNGISSNNAKHWYFGNQAGLKFENNLPLPLTNSAMTQLEGVATMSDINGNLLFYTNGITIYNRNHQVMLNGSGLLSDSSNTQAAFIVPHPGDINKYFVITPNPYLYSIINMTLDNGKGGVEEGNKNILLSSQTSEKIAGVLSDNEEDIWLITYGSNENRFNVFKVDLNGINTTPVVSDFAIPSGFYGYMKLSPDGSKIVMANFNESFHLYDFDISSGEVSNQQIINFNTPIGGYGSYGIEFSPNSQLVYVADHRGQNRVYQFDITKSTAQLIEDSSISLDANGPALGALQLGIDNKIYVARENSNFLGVITNPNVMGVGCSYVEEGVDLAGKTSSLGLPGFIASSLVNKTPYITSFSPMSADVGETISITGTGFNPLNTTLEFNGIEAMITAISETEIKAFVPSGNCSGKISIKSACNYVATLDHFSLNTLSIDKFDLQKTTAYPNPTTGIIRFSERVENLIVYDIRGKKLLGETYLEIIDLSNLSNGLYILKGIDTHQNAFAIKVIKK